SLVGIDHQVVGGGEDNSRVARRCDHVNHTGLVILEKNSVPGLAAVRGFVYAAPGAGCPVITRRRDYDIGVTRIYQYRSDIARVFEAGVTPGFSAVGRLIHAVAGGLFARARINYFRVR